MGAVDYSLIGQVRPFQMPSWADAQQRGFQLRDLGRQEDAARAKLADDDLVRKALDWGTDHQTGTVDYGKAAQWAAQYGGRPDLAAKLRDEADARTAALLKAQRGEWINLPAGGQAVNTTTGERFQAPFKPEPAPEPKPKRYDIQTDERGQKWRLNLDDPTDRVPLGMGTYRPEPQDSPASRIAAANSARLLWQGQNNSENQLRDDYSKQGASARAVGEAFDRMWSAAHDANGVNDMALLYGLMKALDPGSVVREGEFATAQNSQGVPARVTTLYNKVLKGERLAPETRQQILSQGYQQYKRAQASIAPIRAQYRQIAQRQQLNPDNVIVPFQSTGAQEYEATLPKSSATLKQMFATNPAYRALGWPEFVRRVRAKEAQQRGGQ